MASSACVEDPEPSFEEETPIEETDNEAEMEKRRQADLNKFCSKVFNKLIFEGAMNQIALKEEREWICR